MLLHWDQVLSENGQQGAAELTIVGKKLKATFVHVVTSVDSLKDGSQIQSTL